MINSTMRSKAITIGALIVNFLLSWTILPFAIPPFRMYALRELLEVLFWQGVWMIGWPFAILGGLANLILQGKGSELGSLLIILTYPAMLVLLLFVLFSKRSRLWMLILLHVLLTSSFGAIWYQILNGYDFMRG